MGNQENLTSYAYFFIPSVLIGLEIMLQVFIQWFAIISLHMLSFPDPTDLTVTIQSNMTAQEGDVIELCVNLDTGGVGMEISVEVLVAVLECGAGKRSNSSIC